MPQLGRVKAERGAMEARQEALQKTLSVAAEMIYDAIQRLLRQQHELAGRYNQIAGLLPSVASIPASCLVARKPAGTEETHPPPFKHPDPS